MRLLFFFHRECVMTTHQYTFLRHCESLYNRDGVGGYDPELTPDGRKCASKLKGEYDYVLVSCLQRTRETYGLAPGLSGRVVEYSTLCREKMSERHNPANLLKGEEEIGETEEDFKHRISLLKKFLRHRAKQYDTILIVCHAGVIKEAIGEAASNGESFGVNIL